MGFSDGSSSLPITKLPPGSQIISTSLTGCGGGCLGVAGAAGGARRATGAAGAMGAAGAVGGGATLAVSVGIETTRGLPLCRYQRAPPAVAISTTAASVADSTIKGSDRLAIRACGSGRTRYTLTGSVMFLT